MIIISDSAAEFIKNSLKLHDDETMGLRVAVYPDEENSCFNYGFGFDHQSEGDKVFRDNGINIIISASQLDYLDGAEIDYAGIDDGEKHLIVMNHNDPSYVPPKK